MHVPAFGSPLAWIGFVVFVLALVALDLGVFHRKNTVFGPREALAWTGVWVALALGFAGVVYVWGGPTRAGEYLTGYVIEKSLSVDNLFVFLLLFRFFRVPAKLQHHVLLWGILGALAMRAGFILLGAHLIHRFHWIVYVFGAFLVYSAFRLLTQDEVKVKPDKNPVVRLARRVMPVTGDYREGAFVVLEHGKRMATPLLLVLLAVESSDVLFAVDSIPAIFGVTDDAFVVFTSNIFALLGLRSLFFVLEGLMGRFHYLKHALALVLGFVGVKMLASSVVRIPIVVSLGVIVLIMAAAVVASLVWAREHPGERTSSA